VAMIVLHNALDGVRANSFGGYAWIWNMLHQPGAFAVGGQPVIVGYPLVPWIGVMALGFCLGPVLLSAPAARRRTLVRLGLAMTAAFLLLRALNVYGDPSPRSTQSSWTFTMLSFLRTTKYPPSLQFLVMTLGPSLLVLAWFDRVSAWWHSALVVIGRVPFFFYIGHWWILHPLVVVCNRDQEAGYQIPAGLDERHEFSHRYGVVGPAKIRYFYYPLGPAQFLPV